jgi:phosphatidylserine/phosphatidylglycerophosphate/cardiolipin synthase-like enzyme
VAHFIQRWNFVKEQRYCLDKKYTKLGPNFGLSKSNVFDQITPLAHRVHDKLHLYSPIQSHSSTTYPETTGLHAQLCRSATKWSQGVEHEKSIQNAYIDLITHAVHFIYIENQFFSPLLLQARVLISSHRNGRQTRTHQKSNWQSPLGAYPPRSKEQRKLQSHRFNARGSWVPRQR